MNTKKISSSTKMFNKIFSFSFIVVVFACMVSMADFFSSLITVGGFNFVSENIGLSQTNYYAVCTSSHPTKLLASEMSEGVKLQNGAGFIYLSEDVFFVVASIYENISDAEKVKQNLIEKKPETTIVKISIPEIKLSSTLSADEKTVISNSLHTFKNTYKKLYDISVSLDTAVISEVNARLSINQISSDIIKVMGDFNTIFNTNLSTNLLQIKIKLEELSKTTSSLCEETNKYPYSANIKECYCKTIALYKDLASELN